MSKCNQCIVRKHNSLKELTKSEIIRISSCKTERIVKKGEVLFHEGEYLNGILCIKEGVCKISKRSNNGREQIIHLMKKSDLLGERSFINEDASNLKATALSDMEICFIPKEEILNNLNKNQNFTLSVLKNMASSLKHADNFIVDMALKTVKQRLAKLLLYLNDNFNNNNKAIEIHLSREDIGSVVGTIPEGVIRMLSEFKKEKIIKLKSKKIFIIDVKRLEKIAEGF